MVVASGAAVGIIANQPSPEMGFSLRIVVPTAATKMEVAPPQQPSTFLVLDAVAEIAHHIASSQYHNRQEETLPTKYGRQRGEAGYHRNSLLLDSGYAQPCNALRPSFRDWGSLTRRQEATRWSGDVAAAIPWHRLPPFVSADEQR
mmetsp:Transcript_10373/g.29597  ORF Transcript_10373/g.29597 Transcript_10373/m.29597 type:complete len:146 (+) Transcript_10373:3294-3731(+)